MPKRFETFIPYIEERKERWLKDKKKGEQIVFIDPMAKIKF